MDYFRGKLQAIILIAYLLMIQFCNLQYYIRHDSLKQEKVLMLVQVLQRWIIENIWKQKGESGSFDLKATWEALFAIFFFHVFFYFKTTRSKKKQRLYQLFCREIYKAECIFWGILSTKGYLVLYWYFSDSKMLFCSTI